MFRSRSWARATRALEGRHEEDRRDPERGGARHRTLPRRYVTNGVARNPVGGPREEEPQRQGARLRRARAHLPRGFGRRRRASAYRAGVACLRCQDSHLLRRNRSRRPDRDEPPRAPARIRGVRRLRGELARSARGDPESAHTSSSAGKSSSSRSACSRRSSASTGRSRSITCWRSGLKASSLPGA